MGDRFVVEYSESTAVINSITVIRDTETGAAYLFVHSGYAGGLTRLVEGDNG
ncbi:MAG: xylan 1,4-beta-xylosidase [Firmicutes bacterium]|nr:xylan 1,4-beta-xylosidase [Bacillota bacterium]